MQLVHARCAGIDVHKALVVVHARVTCPEGVSHEIIKTGTFTKDLLGLRDWLSERGITHVAMESTGPYWRPVFNILEGGLEILVCNAHHIKNVPGRKTDIKDAEWIAELLAHGLLKPSFVPEAPQRALRDLTRARTVFVRERATVANRIQKLLEEANVKLASVASEILGVSARAMLKAMASGQEDPRALAQKAKGKLRNKIPALAGALEGRVLPHQRLVLRQLLNQVEALDASIENFESAIDEHVRESQVPFERAAAHIETMTGFAGTSAKAVVGEIGTDMSRFGSAKRLCAWAGVAPGNHQSAGKRLSGKVRHGNRHLMAILVEAAWGAVRQKGTYHSALYGRLVVRRGKKRALVAVAHSMLRSIFFMLQGDRDYYELGPDHLDKIDRTRIVNRLARRASELGFELTPAAA